MAPVIRTNSGSLLLGLLLLSGCARSGGRPEHGTVADAATRIPDGAATPSILRGRALFAATGDSLPSHVGNGLRCTSCHDTESDQPAALSLAGVAARFPQFRKRTASVEQLADRINECFRRSLNGTPLDLRDPAMHDMLAYLASMSRGVVAPDSDLAAPALLRHGDTTAGGAVYTRECARCHGTDGAGQAGFPPVWGKRSFSIGAGMARWTVAARFIEHAMPQDRPGSLSPTDAADVAAYITSRARPDLAGKEHDWPAGDAPADTPYATLAGRVRAPDSTPPH